MSLLASILGEKYNGVSVSDVRVFWRVEYFFYGMEPKSNMRNLLLELRDNDTNGPVLPNDKVPPTIQMDNNHPVAIAYQRPLVERCLNYSPDHC